MKALITVESGKMFQIDTHTLLVTLIDKLGKPVNSRPLEIIPSVVPGCPFILTSGDGVEITEEKVIQVIYSR
jgi:hypothetical protein